jgi:hypothetical protein
MTIMIGSAGVAAAAGIGGAGNMVAGLAGFDPNKIIGYNSSLAIGSITPDPSFVTGFEIQAMETADFLNVLVIRLLPTGIINSDSVWATVEFTGVFRVGGSETHVYTRSAMGYNPSISGATQWQTIMSEGDDGMMVEGNSYFWEFT